MCHVACHPFNSSGTVHVRSSAIHLFRFTSRIVLMSFINVLLGGESTSRPFNNIIFELLSRRASSSYNHEASNVLRLFILFCVGFDSCNILSLAGQPYLEADPDFKCLPLRLRITNEQWGLPLLPQPPVNWAPHVGGKC